MKARNNDLYGTISPEKLHINVYTKRCQMSSPSRKEMTDIRSKKLGQLLGKKYTQSEQKEYNKDNRLKLKGFMLKALPGNDENNVFSSCIRRENYNQSPLLSRFASLKGFQRIQKNKGRSASTLKRNKLLPYVNEIEEKESRKEKSVVCIRGLKQNNAIELLKLINEKQPKRESNLRTIERRKSMHRASVFSPSERTTRNTIAHKSFRLYNLLNCLNKLRKMHLTPNDLVNYNVFSKKPFGKPNSQQFFLSIKVGNIAAVKQFIKMNRYLIFDFDHVSK